MVDMEIVWTPVKNSRFKAVSYDTATRVLYIKFNPDKNGDSAVYSYANVEPQRFQEFIAAPSLGRYFGDHFKSSKDYPYRKVGMEAEKPSDK